MYSLFLRGLSGVHWRLDRWSKKWGLGLPLYLPVVSTWDYLWFFSSAGWANSTQWTI